MLLKFPGLQRKFKRAVADIAALSIFAGLPLSLLHSDSSNAIIWTLTHQSLPSDACTELPPLSPPLSDYTPQQKSIAQACENFLKKGTFVIIDGVGFGEEKDKKLAAEAQQFERQLSGGYLQQKVVVVPASPKTKETLAALEPLGTPKDPAPVPAADQSPAAIALATMPDLRKKYPNAVFVDLSPQVVGDSPKKEYAGLAYTGAHVALATVYVNEEVSSMDTIMIFAHEGIGHEDGLGHKGALLFVPAKVQDNTITLNLKDTTYQYTVTKGKPGEPVTQITEYGKEGTFQEYADASGDPMGSGAEYGATNVGSDSATFSQTEKDLLELPQAILQGNNNMLHERFIDNNWTTINTQDINSGDYAMMSLIKPVSLQGAFDGSTTFGTFAIHFQYVPPDKLASLGGRYMTFRLYDAERTHNEASGQQIFLKNNTSFTIKIENGDTLQYVELKSTPSGITLRTYHT